MNKQKVTQKINEIDEIFNQLDHMRREAMLLINRKNNLEKKIIKLMKKQRTITRVETQERIYMLRKKIEVNEQEEAVARLVNYLQAKGKKTKSIREWKAKMFQKKKPKTILIVYRKNI